MLEGADDLGDLPLLARRSGERGDGVRVDDLECRQLRRRPRRPARIRLGDAVNGPDPQSGIAIGIERVKAFGLIGRDRDARPRPDAGRAERELNRDWLRESLAPPHHHFEIHGAVAGQRRLRLHDLEVERQRLDDRRRELVDLRSIVDGVVRLPENEVGKVLEGSPHLDVVILGTSFERHQAPRQRRVGCRLEHHRHLRHRPRHLAEHGRDSGRKRTGLEDQVAAEVRAGRIDEHRISIAARHHDLLTGLRIPIDPRDRERQRRGHWLEFDAVDEIGAPAAEVIGDTDDVLPVLRHLKPEVGIGPPGIVVAGDPRAIGPEDVDDRIETAADPPRETFDFEYLPLRGREPEAIDVAVGADDAIEGKRRLPGGRLSRGVVRLNLEKIALRCDPERDRGGADPVGVLGKEGEDGSRRRHGHILHDRPSGIAEECH